MKHNVFWILLLAFANIFAQNSTFPVKKITFSGNKKTKNKIVRLLITVEEGDTLTQESLEKQLEISKNNLYNTALFTKVSTTYSQDSGFYFIDFQLAERWYFFPIAYAAIENRTFGEWWQDKDFRKLSLGGGFSWDNFTGRYDRLYFYAQDGYTRNIDTYFYRPFALAHSKIDVKLDFKYFANKETPYQTENAELKYLRLENDYIRIAYFTGLNFIRRFTARKKLSFRTEFQHFQISDSLRLLRPDYFSNHGNLQEYPQLSLGFVNDQRDVAAYPLEGFKYWLSLASVNPLSSFGSLRFSGGINQFFPLNKHFNLSYAYYLDAIAGNQLSYHEKIFHGYTLYVRGYQNYVITSTLSQVLKTEMKFAIIPRKIIHLKKIKFKQFKDSPLGLYATAFVDAGYVDDFTKNNQDNLLKNKLLSGYGVGLNFYFIYDTLLRVEYAWNNLGQSGIFFNTRLSIR